MFIREVHIQNYRSILDETMACDSLTALVGRNGAGKSTFLSALELFYDHTASVTQEDFYAEDVTQDIEIAVTFEGLTAESKELFAPYIDNDTLTVVRVFDEPQSKRTGTYHGVRLQNPDFQPIRQAGGNREATKIYNELRSKPKYDKLPPVRAAEAARMALADWEDQNPDQCSRIRDDGQFFGFTQVAQGYLGRFTKFIHIPAVRDAQADVTERRGSCVTEIMDLVVRNLLANRKDFTTFKESTQAAYRTIMNAENLTELTSLEQSLSATLNSYVPDASILLRWSQFDDIHIPMPQAQVRLRENDYESSVDRSGHGLQRALIVTMLQHLVAARESDSIPADQDTGDDSTTASRDSHLPSLVLAIEEPELYQHPSRQRHLASVLLKLASGLIPGVAERTQVLYTTHSPLFVGLDHFAKIRVLRKAASTIGRPKVSRLAKADLEEVAEELWVANGSEGSRFTAATLRPRLQAIMTPWMSEGFFADTVVLVEGEDDRAAILGVANSMNCDFDSQGITVIPCFGKNNIDRPLVIFRQLGIPVYVVWDGDHGSDDATPESNRYLLRLLDRRDEDWPDFVGGSGACFKVNLEKSLEDEVGKDLFDQLLVSAQQQLGIRKRSQALKNAAVIEHIIEKANESDQSSGSLERIVGSITALNAKGNSPA